MPQETLEKLLDRADKSRDDLLKRIRDKRVDPNNLDVTFSIILATRTVQRELAAQPDSFRLAIRVQNRYNELREAYRTAATPYVIGKLHKNLNKIMARDEAGEVLERAFHQALVGSVETAGREKLDPALNPTAREQIEALQKRLKSGKLSQKDQKIKALGQILAAREVLGIRAGVRGGDPQLDRRLTPEVYVKAREFEGLLRGMTDKELDGLSTKALAGHGGNLTKEYYQIRRKAVCRMDPVPEDLPRNLWPSAKNHIEVLQVQLKQAQDYNEKLRCMAGILAARELVSAKRGGIFGGDEMLTKRFDPHKLGPRAAIIEGNLRLMYQEDQLRLFNLAKEGHGGEMMESYRKENNYNNHMTSLHLFAKSGKLDVAAAMAIREGYNLHPHAEVKDAELQKLVEEIRREPGYGDFQENPQIQKAMEQGKFDAVKEAFQQLVAENIANKTHPAPKEEQIELLDDQIELQRPAPQRPRQAEGGGMHI